MVVFEDIYQPYKMPSFEDRCAPRVRLCVPAKLRFSGGQPFSVIVTDLSVAGFRCEVSTGKQPPALCWLTLPGLASQQAEVAWNDSIQMGCAFSNLLDLAVLDHVLAVSGSKVQRSLAGDNDPR